MQTAQQMPLPTTLYKHGYKLQTTLTVGGISIPCPSLKPHGSLTRHVISQAAPQCDENLSKTL
jgi:hypothetical protein